MSVNCSSAINVTDTSLTLTGTTTALGGSDEVYFFWGNTPGGPYPNQVVAVDQGGDNWSANLTGLSPLTDYYYVMQQTGPGGGPIIDTSTECTEQTLSDLAITCPADRSDETGPGVPNIPVTRIGGTAPFTFAATNIPPGINFDTALGNFTGGPTVAGTYTVEVTVTDGIGSTAVCTFVWTVTQGSVAELNVIKNGNGDRNSFQPVGGNYVYEIRITNGVDLSQANNVSILDPVVGAGVTRAWEVIEDFLFNPPLSPTSGTGDINFTGQTAGAGIVRIKVTDTYTQAGQFTNDVRVTADAPVTSPVSSNGGNVFVSDPQCAPATGVTDVSADLAGVVNGGQSFRFNFSYGTVSGGPYPNSTAQVGGVAGPAATSVSGLTPDTDYFYVLNTYDSDLNLIGTSPECTFRTLPAQILPSAGCAGATSITDTSALLGGTLFATPVGGSSEFQYGPPGGPYANVIPIDPPYGDGQAFADITGLTPSTNYGYVLVLKDAGGTVVATSPECTFVTTSVVITPGAGCSPATAIGIVDAVVNGTISGMIPGYQARFVYGETSGGPYTNFAISTPQTDGAVSAQLFGLSPTTLYFYTLRIIDTNNANAIVAASTECSFTTVAAVVPIDLSPIANQTSTTGLPITAITPSASGGTVPYTFTATGLPAGLSINPATGQISGTPTTQQVATPVTVTVTDSLGQTDQQTFTWTINQANVNATASCSPATNITTNSATLRGNVTGVTGTTNGVSIRYGLTPGGPYPNVGNGLPLADGAVTRIASGLSANTLYYYVVEVVDGNNVVLATSSECNFTSSAVVTPPVVPGQRCPVPPGVNKCPAIQTYSIGGTEYLAVVVCDSTGEQVIMVMQLCSGVPSGPPTYYDFAGAKVTPVLPTRDCASGFDFEQFIFCDGGNEEHPFISRVRFDENGDLDPDATGTFEIDGITPYVPVGPSQVCGNDVCLPPVSFCFKSTLTEDVEGRQYDITLPLAQGFAVEALLIDLVSYPLNIGWAITDIDGSQVATALQAALQSQFTRFGAQVTVTPPNITSTCSAPENFVIHIECIEINSSVPTLVQLRYNAGRDLVQNPAYVETPIGACGNGDAFDRGGYRQLRRIDNGGTLNCTAAANRGWESNDALNEFEVWCNTGVTQQLNVTPTPRGTPVQEINANGASNNPGDGITNGQPDTIWQTFVANASGQFLIEAIVGGRTGTEQFQIRLSTGDTDDTGIGDLINDTVDALQVTNRSNPWTRYTQTVNLTAGQTYTLSLRGPNTGLASFGGLFTDLRAYQNVPGTLGNFINDDDTCLISKTTQTTTCSYWQPNCSGGLISEWRKVDTGEVLTNAAFWAQVPAPICCLSDPPDGGGNTAANLAYSALVCGEVGGITQTLIRQVISDASGGIISEIFIGLDGAPVNPVTWQGGQCQSGSTILTLEPFCFSVNAQPGVIHTGYAVVELSKSTSQTLYYYEIDTGTIHQPGAVTTTECVHDQDPVLLCDANGSFLRHVVYGAWGNILRVTDTTLAGAPYVPGAIIPCVTGCENTVSYEQRCQYDPLTGAPVGAPMFVTTVFDCDGIQLSQVIRDLNGDIAVPTGILAPCGVSLSYEQQVLCDGNTRFLRHYVYAQTGQVINTVDTQLDGVTAYAPTGVVDTCDVLDVEGVSTCIEAVNAGTGYSVGDQVAHTRWYSLETGLPVQIGETATNTTAGGTPVALPLVAADWKACSTGCDFTYSRESLCQFDAVTGQQVGPSVVVTSAYNCQGIQVSQTITDNSFTPVIPVGVLSPCHSKLSYSQQIFCDDNGSFIRHYTYQQTGVVVDITDTGLDGLTAYTPVGDIKNCGPSGKTLVQACDHTTEASVAAPGVCGVNQQTVDAVDIQDAEEKDPASGLEVNVNDNDLEMAGVAESGESDHQIAVRFMMNVPQGARVCSAYIQFTSRGSVSYGDLTATISGEDVDASAPFVTNNGELSARTKTTAAVDWPVPLWPTGSQTVADQRTPDLSTIVQEIVDRPGWVAGNNTAFFFVPGNTGYRRAQSITSGTAVAPKLHVEYVLDAPGGDSEVCIAFYKEIDLSTGEETGSNYRLNGGTWEAYTPTGTVTDGECLCAGIPGAGDNDFEILCLQDSNNVQFARVVAIDGTSGAYKIVGDYALDFSGQYTPVGSVAPCGDTYTSIDNEVVTLCDDNGAFLRHIAYDSGGTVQATVDTTLDGMTDYTTVGTIKTCQPEGKPCLTCRS